MRLPDETQANMSQLDNSTTNQNTLSDMNLHQTGSSSKKLKGDRKSKKVDDNVVDSGTLPDGDMPATKKRRRGGNNKGNKDDVTEGTIGETKKNEKKKRKKKNEGADNIETTQQHTNFGTKNTQQDFL